jgi:hypothetical protein
MLARSADVKRHMDVFTRTFLPAAAEAGVAIPAVSRQMPIFRRCVEPDDTTVLVSRCSRPDAPLSGEFTMVLTRRRLVVIQETRVFHRLRLHLNAHLRHLSNVSWNADVARSALEITATAVDGVRERFQLRPASPEAVVHFDSLLRHVFRTPRASAAQPAMPRAAALAKPVAQPTTTRPAVARPAIARPAIPRAA